MDIKLSLDGNITLTDGDFTLTVGDEELSLNINKIIRSWVGSFNMGEYIGKRNNRSNAKIIKRNLDMALQKHYPQLASRVVPVNKDKIAIFVGIPSSNITFHQTIYNYEDGILEYLDSNTSEKYRAATNEYIIQ